MNFVKIKYSLLNFISKFQMLKITNETYDTCNAFCFQQNNILIKC